MSFGDVIQSVNAPLANVRGIGGDLDTVWSCDFTKLHELIPSDLSNHRTANPPGLHPYGIGGDANTIWHTDNNADDVYELSITDFSIIQSRGSPSSAPTGIGGDANTVWHCDTSSLKVYELSDSDLSEIRQRATPVASWPGGVGGSASVIWYCEYRFDKIYELLVSDLSDFQSANAPSTDSIGIGGNLSTIWYCEENNNKNYQLDSAKTFTISGTISDEFGNPIRDADITISDGTIYTTTSDEDGEYSKVVNAETYDITVIKPRSRFHDITQSSVSVAADTTQNITMLTDKMIGVTVRKGMATIGGLSLGR